MTPTNPPTICEAVMSDEPDDYLALAMGREDGGEQESHLCRKLRIISAHLLTEEAAKIADECEWEVPELKPLDVAMAIRHRARFSQKDSPTK